MKKTSRGLVDYVKSMIGMPYVCGTYGKTGSRDILELKRRQYPEQFSEDYNYILEHWEVFNNKPWHDAPGLIKGYYWQNERGSIVYKLDARADLSAGGLFRASDKNGPISEMPNVPGLLVYYPGHIGVYVGNGEVVEAADVKKGIICSFLSERPFTHWCRCPYITYGRSKKESEPKLLPGRYIISISNDVSLNLRKKPGINSEIIKALPRGSELTITALSGSWGRAECGTQTGWVSFFNNGRPTLTRIEGAAPEDLLARIEELTIERDELLSALNEAHSALEAISKLCTF